MSEFTPITTQEEFDSRLSERLAQKERSVTKKFEGYTSPEDLAKIREGYDNQISNLNGKLGNAEKEYSKKFEGYTSPEDLEKIKNDYDDKIATYERDSVKTKIAIEMGLPLELKDRLRGENEEEIRKDAKLLSGFASNAKEPPLAGYDPVIVDDKPSKQNYKNLLNGLNLEKE